jgi:hypothetical protein
VPERKTSRSSSETGGFLLREIQQGAGWNEGMEELKTRQTSREAWRVFAVRISPHHFRYTINPLSHLTGGAAGRRRKRRRGVVVGLEMLDAVG